MVGRDWLGVGDPVWAKVMEDKSNGAGFWKTVEAMCQTRWDVDQARKITLQDEPTCNVRLLDSQNPLYVIQDDPKSRPTTNRISHQNHSRNPLLPTDNSKDTVFNDTSSFTYKDPNLNLKTEESVDVNLLGGFEIKSIEEMISKRGLHHDQKSLLENTDYGIKLKDLKSNSKSFCGTQTARLPT